MMTLSENLNHWLQYFYRVVVQSSTFPIRGKIQPIELAAPTNLLRMKTTAVIALYILGFILSAFILNSLVILIINYPMFPVIILFTWIMCKKV